MSFELKQCIGSRLRRLSRIADSYFRECLSEFDISENQMTLLFALHSFGEVDQGRIGHELILDKSTVSRNIKLLEKKGYVIKSSDYHPQLTLSKNGKDLVSKLIPIWEETMNTLSSKLGLDGMKMIKSIELKLE